MPATKQRKTHPAMTPARIRELSELAKKIDREEADEIKALGRVLKARHEKLREIVRTLVAERLGRGLSLSSVAEASEIGKANLSRLENHPNPNPTLETILRYADAMGLEVNISLSEKRAKE